MAVSSRGLINFNVQAEDAEIAQTATLSMDYEFIGYGEVLVANNACDFCDALIAKAEALDAWSQSTVARSDARSGYHDPDQRSSKSVPLDHPSLSMFNRRVGLVAKAALQLYTMKNEHIQVTGQAPVELLRYENGEQFGLHVDVIPGDSPQRTVSVLVYLNDDYEGGEIQFPRQNITYKPRRGSVLMFPSNFVYPHTSTPVTKGSKYVAVTWFLG